MAPTQDRPTHLEIKDWREHQHYGKRRPPWIKVYAKLLTNAAFLGLPEAAQAQLMKLWILASQMAHPLPNNPKQLAGLIGAPGRLYLDALVAAGFLIPCYQNASKVLAESEQDASTLVQSSESRDTEKLPVEDGDAIRAYSLELTAKANAAARQKWRAEPWMQGGIPSFTMSQELIAAGVPVGTAVARVVTQIESSGMPNPPKTLRYFLPGCLETNANSRPARRTRKAPQQFDYTPTDGDVTWAK